MEIEYRDKHFAFFQHKECEFFPCHKTNRPEDFNCLFCYCPLYALGENCGGNFFYTEKGFKDCTNCMFPHVRDNYPKIILRYNEIIELTKRDIDREREAAEAAAAEAEAAEAEACEAEQTEAE